MPWSATSEAATSSCVDSGLEAHSATSAPPAASVRIRFAVSLVTCRQAETRIPCSGRSAAKRSRICASTGICRSAHSILRAPASARPRSATSCRAVALIAGETIARTVRTSAPSPTRPTPASTTSPSGAANCSRPPARSAPSQISAAQRADPDQGIHAQRGGGEEGEHGGQREHEVPRAGDHADTHRSARPTTAARIGEQARRARRVRREVAAPARPARPPGAPPRRPRSAASRARRSATTPDERPPRLGGAEADQRDDGRREPPPGQPHASDQPVAHEHLDRRPRDRRALRRRPGSRGSRTPASVTNAAAECHLADQHRRPRPATAGDRCAASSADSADGDRRERETASPPEPSRDMSMRTRSP